MARRPRPTNPKVIVTRRLPGNVEARMGQLFDAQFNMDDTPMDRAALAEAMALAEQIAAFPQTCLRQDRLSSYEQWGMEMPDALRNEYRRGRVVLESNEVAEGAARFAAGEGRHGRF